MAHSRALIQQQPGLLHCHPGEPFSALQIWIVQAPARVYLQLELTSHCGSQDWTEALYLIVSELPELK